MVNEAFFVRLFFINSWSLEKRRKKKKKKDGGGGGGGGGSRLLAINSISVDAKGSETMPGEATSQSN